MKYQHAFKVVTNSGKEVLHRGVPDTIISSLHCEAMEEADPRIITHIKDMVQKSAKSVLIRSSDTDVVVLAISDFYELSEFGLQVFEYKILLPQHKGVL